MRTADFDYTLPEELIAQAPMEPRDAARLLVVRRGESSFAHHYVHELPTLLEPGDLLVANRSRVLPARIVGRLRGGGRAEMLLLRKLAPGSLGGAWPARSASARRRRRRAWRRPAAARQRGGRRRRARDRGRVGSRRSRRRPAGARAACRCRRTSTAGSAIPSATRPCLPTSKAPPPRRPPACTSRRA